jgi:hypothetical protein
MTPSLKLLYKQHGSIHELANNPMAAMLAAQAFAGSKFHRAKPTYSPLKGDAFSLLSENDKAHVKYAVEHRAKALNCAVSDLAWAVSARRTNGVCAVMVKKWEDIEREAFEAKA